MFFLIKIFFIISATIPADSFPGMVPGIVVTAPRYQEDFSNYAIKISTPEIDFDKNFDLNSIPCSRRYNSDFKLSAKDTIDEDVVVSAGNAQIDGVIDGDLAVMGGEVNIKGKVIGDVAVFGGNLSIPGLIKGDAAVFGGNVINSGMIEGDLFVMGGTVRLDSGSVIEGDIGMVGGSVDRDDNAEVKGEIKSIELGRFNKLLPDIARAFRFQKKLPGKRVFRGLFSFITVIVIYIINLLLLLIFPRAVNRIEERIRMNIWAVLGIGIGLEILYIPLILLFTLSIIGIPLIPIFILAVFFALLFGLTSFSIVIGRRIVQGLEWSLSNRVGIFSLGWIAIMVIPIIGMLLRGSGFLGSFIFILGVVILYVVATLGLGGVVYALIKLRQASKK
ncbi:hypothetical protein BXT86_01490 [candidate division WOR-3 bacterium 4484_100]|uniref:Polymer-forming cytoskeletal protein n=1 Tax=candidate division WOR-3 bacterium 4484_100 TaxID=1936077 RepID=A0A1V4QGM4_UNCW3|nr:MAG: hypothetical protein BXT86_01490 [candidate division WOR-3 bacterium 4484_100]